MAGILSTRVVVCAFLLIPAYRHQVSAYFRHHLHPLIADHPHLQLRVIFRSNEDNSPNVFALPDGTLIFTDAMVLMAKEDDELLAIAAHEVGHV